jgi:ABC-type dipeptide/oligopeptide/nickel transport system permease subunit
MFMAFPSILLAVAISAMFDERSLAVVFIALGIVGWTTAARVVRGQVMAAKNNEYVLAARSLGAGDIRILFVHVLPNCIAPVIVIGSIMVAGNILAEAGLSFLGVGVQPPEPSWGGMLRESMGMWDWPWMSIFPGAAIALSVLAFNLLGDGLRDALDPRMNG